MVAPTPRSGCAASIAGRGIVRRFETDNGPFVAVDDVSFKIERGEFVSLIGPSGCGKSTLMLMAAGLQPVSGGELAVDGVRLARPLTDVGIVFQDHLLLEFRTAMANVMLQAEVRGLPIAETRARAGRLFEKLGIADAADRYPKQLSAACASACRSPARSSTSRRS